jgi:hypothetical protein
VYDDLVSGNLFTGFFDTVGRFDRAWQADRVVCNGCQYPSEWQGPAADLRLALARVQQDGARPVLVLDANLYFWPRFNFQVCLHAPSHSLWLPVSFFWRE